MTEQSPLRYRTTGRCQAAGQLVGDTPAPPSHLVSRSHQSVAVNTHRSTRHIHERGPGAGG